MEFRNFSTIVDSTFLGPRLDWSIREFPSLQSPVPLAIVASYVLFVCCLGPKLMKNRKAFDLKKIILTYNLMQIVLNAVLFTRVWKLIFDFNFLCTPVSDANNERDILSREFHYYYTILKFIDLCDTVFFVLRKKDNQVSILHLHHHIVIALTSWISLIYVPGGVNLIVGLCNTVGHVALYTYYLLSSLHWSKILLWKKHFSRLQLAMNLVICCVFITHLLNPQCSYPKGWLTHFLINMIIFLSNFIQFYKQTYIKSDTKSE